VRHPERIAVTFVVFTAAAIWFCSGVEASEAARFVVFEALYVVLPGCLLYRMLMPDAGGWLRTLAIGWPAGYAIEVGAFAVSAALGQRGAFVFLPLISVGLFAVLLRRDRSRGHLRRRRGLEHAQDVQVSSPATTEFVCATLAIGAALVLLALTSFAIVPLPWHLQSVVYPENYLLSVSLATEALNHWPITTPWIAGLPLHYYTAVFIHGAAINQVTGVALPTVYFRLVPTSATLLLALQLWSVARSMTLSRLAGPLAIVLFFLVGAASLNPTRGWPLEGESLTFFWGNATFMFSALFLLALFGLVQQWLYSAASRTDRDRSTPLSQRDVGALVMFAVLVLGCGAAKTFGVVDFVAGLGLFWLWGVSTGRVPRIQLQILVIAAVCVGIVYLTMLAGGSAKLVTVRPLNSSIAHSVPLYARKLAVILGGYSPLWATFSLGALTIELICLSAPVLGAVWPRVRRRPISAFEVFCLAVLAAGYINFYLTYSGAAGGEIYFRYFGYLALVLLASSGLATFWSETPVNARRSIVVASSVVLVFGLAIASGAYVLVLSGRPEYLWYAVMYALLAGVVILMVRRLYSLYAPVISSRAGRILACCIPLLGVLGLVQPIAHAAVGAKSVIVQQTLAPRDSPEGYGITRPLYRGLMWVRAHTRTCDVLAVNNHYSRQSTNEAAAFLYYSAFTGRHIFVESWANTSSGVRSGAAPFPGRLALNEKAIATGDPAALRDLAQAGVTYVLVDEIHRGGAREPPSVSRLVFSNGALDVYRLSAGTGASHPRLGCSARE
jgi:hypothetical protein